MSYKYSRYIKHVTRHPWALLPDKLETIAELMQLRASGHKLSDEEIAERFGMEAAAGGSRTQTDGSGIIAVIPVHGCIAYRADSFDASSGGTSAELIGKALQRVVFDPGVSTVVLDFNTPGGSVEGIPELAGQIAAAARVKPIVAHVNAQAASAGFWLASQCSEIVCTPSGAAGSIGVYMLNLDESEALAKDGIKVNAISAGEYKLEGAPWMPLSDEARAFMQSYVDKTYAEFLSTVAAGRSAAKGRTVTVANVLANYGKGRCFDAPDALKLGMIDRIETQAETLDRLAGQGSRVTTRLRAASVAGAGQLAAAHAPPVVVAESSVADGDDTIVVVPAIDGLALAMAIVPDVSDAMKAKASAEAHEQAADRDAIAILIAISD